MLDGNVRRSLARHLALEGWTGKASVQKELWLVAQARLPSERGADYTQAVMDLGALICTRSNPSCTACPVNQDCAASLKDEVHRYPSPKPATRVTSLKLNMLIIKDDAGRVLLVKRPPTGIWGGLWSLPELGERSIDDWCDTMIGAEVSEVQSWDVLRHSFSHYDLDIQPIVVRIASRAGRVADRGSTTWYSLDDAPPGGFAAPVKKLINQLKKSENVAHH